MSPRKTSVEINEDLLHEVQRVEARRKEIEELSAMRGLDLADPDVMGRAWRAPGGRQSR